MDKEKIKLEATKIGQWLKANAPGVLGVIGDAVPYPFSAVVKLAKGLVSSMPNISDVAKTELNTLAPDFEKEINDIEQMYLNDTQDARKLQTSALSQDDKFSKRFIYYLAAFSVLAGFIYVYLVTYVSIPTANQRFADTMSGVLITTVFGTIYSFFFGSSKTSKDKSETIDKMIDKQ